MDFGFHHANNRGEFPELPDFRRSQRILFEERDDAVWQVSKGSHIVSIEILSMVVVTPVDEDVTAAEVLLQIVKNNHAPRALNYRKTRLDLPAKPIAGIPKERNTEAAFTVDEADDPLLDFWPFLLIARTGRVFTAHVETLSRPTDMNEYRRILGCSSK
jgi:hypothetical protein